MIRQTLVANLDDAHIREVVEDGKRWIVAPAAILIEGVLNGSKGALFYPNEENRRTAHLWDRVPLTHNHPFDPITNQPLDASDPGVVQRQHIGETRAPRWDGKTRVEAWFDAEATRNKAPEVYQQLMKRQKIALSTGLYTDNEPRQGFHNNVPYTAVARNHRPDHLAVLPNQRGACHLTDGCGIGVTNAARILDETTAERLMDADAELVTVNADGEYTINPFVSEEQRRYLWANEPEIAKAWAHGEHTSDKDDHRMPDKTGSDVKGPLAKAERKEQRDKRRKEKAENQESGGWWGKFVAFITNTPKHPRTGKFTPQKDMLHAHAEHSFAKMLEGDKCPECGGHVTGNKCQACGYVVNVWSDEARQAATEARAAGAKATKSGEGEDHREAVTAHLKAAYHAAKDNEHETAAQHYEQANVHSVAAQRTHNADWVENWCNQHGGNTCKEAIDSAKKDSENADALSAKASTKSEHAEAAEAHFSAAMKHRGTNPYSKTVEHLDKADEHYAKAGKENPHKLGGDVPGYNEFTANDFDSDAQRRAFFAKIGKSTDDANLKSIDAHMAEQEHGDKSYRSDEAHYQAAMSHEGAAAHHARAGNKSMEKYHRERAEQHWGKTEVINPKVIKTENSMKLNEKERKAIVDALVSNCKCQAANVWEESDRAALNVLPDSKLLRLKAQRDKAITNEEDDSSYMEEREEDENERRMRGKKTQNVAPASMTPSQLMATMNTLNKINALTQGIADEKERAEMVANLAQKSDAELDLMVKLVGNSRQLVQQFVPQVLPMFLGAGGGPTNNTQVDSGAAPQAWDSPTINWQELSEERRKKAV